jgi:hypothetical protein
MGTTTHIEATAAAQPPTTGKTTQAATTNAI